METCLPERLFKGLLKYPSLLLGNLDGVEEKPDEFIDKLFKLEP